jgi:hypothetical protein|tara:strand:+ start:295 stop:435 length:141 start_codon:yes stop_codon:yes gene_type:complete
MAHDSKDIILPIAVKCKRMKAANVRCGFEKEITDENQATTLRFRTR